MFTQEHPRSSLAVSWACCVNLGWWLILSGQLSFPVYNTKVLDWVIAEIA